MLTLKILFWAMLLIVFYTYIGYGILLYIIIRLKRLFRGTPLKAAMPSDEELPTMTLMICAYNEEDGRKNEKHLRDRLSERQIQNHVGDRWQQRPYKRIIKGLS